MCIYIVTRVSLRKRNFSSRQHFVCWPRRELCIFKHGQIGSRRGVAILPRQWLRALQLELELRPGRGVCVSAQTLTETALRHSTEADRTRERLLRRWKQVSGIVTLLLLIHLTTSLPPTVLVGFLARMTHSVWGSWGQRRASPHTSSLSCSLLHPVWRAPQALYDSGFQNSIW